MPRVTNPGLGGAGQVATLTTTTVLNAAQIIAMHTTPVTVVPAPGPGMMLIPICAVAVLRFGTRRFLPTEASGVGIAYASTPTNGQLGAFAGMLVQTQDAEGFLANFQQFVNLLLPGVDNNALVVTSDIVYNQGPIVTTTLGAGGAGYVVNDTGTISTGSGDATYKVLTVGGGGVVLTYQITAPGTSYATANGVATAVGGAQPGVGAGFTVNITAVATGDGTLKIVTYYQIIPVP